MAEITEELVSLSDLNSSIGKLQNIVSEMTKALRNEKADIDDAENLLIQLKRDIKGLEENEKKLIEDFNQVMSNLYLLPGYVLAVSTGVSGLLDSNPRFCWLFSPVVIVALVFLVSMSFAIRFAYNQLKILEAMETDLANERGRLHQLFLSNKDSFDRSTNNTDLDLVFKSLESYETKNSELRFQAKYYDKYLILITLCGCIYAFMLLFAGYSVLCGSQENPVGPVPEHLPFSSRSSGPRLHQDM